MKFHNNMAYASALAAALIAGVAASSQADTLIDDSFADGDRLVTGASAGDVESDFYVGSGDVVTNVGTGLTYPQSTGSTKLHSYFTDPTEMVVLGVGETLSLSVDFIPLGTVANIMEESGSRSFRFGLFSDPDGGRVEIDTNDGGGGDGDPWTNADGYGIQMLMHADPTGDLFRIGKRVNDNSNIQGSSGAYEFPSSGGDMVSFAAGTQYTLQLDVTKTSATETDVTASLLDASGALLSTHSITDDGLGGEAPTDVFNFLHGRFSNAEETASALQFRNFTVVGPTPTTIPEPGALALAALAAAPLALRRRRR